MKRSRDLVSLLVCAACGNSAASDVETGSTNPSTTASSTTSTTSTASTSTTTGDGAASTTGPLDGSSSEASTGAPPSMCTAPVFETSTPDDGWSTENYYVHNNMWNSECCQTLYACSYADWYVVSNQIDEAGAVKTFPNVHRDYDGKRIDSFPVLTSTFAATSPHVGIYNVAYDIWINGIAAPGGAELMIWTENFNQVPGGDMVASADFGGVTWQAWKADWDWTYLALVPEEPLTEGELDLLEMLEWTIAQGWVPADATIDQIGFGVEIVSTDGNDEAFVFSGFAIDDGS
ncbi:MAG TPA: hypothetical protein VG755_15005 [Nannocystaceae bacterium]|nr:hypothetical protein [Nannocystaceae bacterium]